MEKLFSQEKFKKAFDKARTVETSDLRGLKILETIIPYCDCTTEFLNNVTREDVFSARAIIENNQYLLVNSNRCASACDILSSVERRRKVTKEDLF